MANNIYGDDAPCKDCKERSADPNCHDPNVCKRYAEFLKCVKQTRANERLIKQTSEYGRSLKKKRIRR